MLVSDAPQRAPLLHYKTPKNSTKLPCSLCLVTQTGIDGGDLGYTNFSIHLDVHSRALLEESLAKLAQNPKNSAPQKTPV